MDKIQGMTELQVLSKILNDKSFSFVERFNLDESYFNTPIYNEDEKPTGYSTKNIFKFIKTHYEQYKTTPSSSTVSSYFPDFIKFDSVDSDGYLIKSLKEDRNDLLFNDLWNKVRDLYNTKGSSEAVKYLDSHIKDYQDIPLGNIGIDIAHEGLDKRMETYKTALENPEKVALMTGLKELDEAIGGLGRYGELAIIQARMGQAKTFLMMKIAHYAWKNGENVCLFEPEMDVDSIGYRFDSSEGGFSNFKLRHGRKIEQDYSSSSEYAQKVKSNPNKFMYVCQEDFNYYTTVSKLKAFCKENKITFLLLDGINSDYILDERAERDTRTDVKMGHICDDLLALSRELNIPVLAVVQAVRVGKDDELGNNTIAGSIDIPRKATITMSMNRKKDSGIIEIKIDKNRNGSDCKVLNYIVDLDKQIWHYDSSGTENSSIGVSTAPSSSEVSSVTGVEGSMRRTITKEDTNKF